MKPLYKKLSTASIILFIIGIIVVAYFQYTAADRIVGKLNISGSNQIDAVRGEVNTITLFVGLEIAVGLLAILLLVSNYQKASRNITAGKSEVIHKSEGGTELNHQEQAVQIRIQAIESLMLQTFPKPEHFFEKSLSILCRELEASQAACYMVTTLDNKRVIRLITGYALSLPESQTLIYEFGEGLAGQVAKEGRLINIQNVPQGYITILSGLGSASPNALVIVPVQLADKVVGVLEVASFREFHAEDESYLQAVAHLLSERFAQLMEEKTLVLEG